MLGQLIGKKKRQKIYSQRDKMPIYDSGTRDIMREDRITYMIAE
jgi:hypothetical protein